MDTYKQEVKEKTRNIIWSHAVDSLTIHRRDVRIFKPDYMDHLWEYCKETLHKYLIINNINETVYNDWLEFADITYNTKKASELKVAFFCGPEPENDVKVLLKKGIRLENMYAFEYDKDIFKQAVENLHTTYPYLKIFNGKIEDFLELNSVKFDIVYLDFTRSLLKEYKTIFKLIDYNSLSELSVLAINTTIPEKNEENIRFLADYFFNTPMFEYGVMIEDDESPFDNEDLYGRICEGCNAYGIYELEQLEPYVKRNFEAAYSAFQTNFIISYANLLKPTYSVLNNSFLSKRIFDIENVDKIFKDLEFLGNWEFKHYVSGNQGLHQLIAYAFKDDNFFNVKDKGCKYSRVDASYFYDFYKSSQYDGCDFIISSPLKESIIKIENSILGAKGGMFCDIPMIHLWLELIINQYGNPYHFNMENHIRYKYKAKKRDMYFDVFTFDRCRSLYDWLPMIEYYGMDLNVLERQMLSRMCVDAIGKHSIFNLDQLYWGSALIGLNEKEWSVSHNVPIRKTVF